MTNKTISFNYPKGALSFAALLKIYMEQIGYAYLHNSSYVSDPSQFNLITDRGIISESEMKDPSILDQYAESKTEVCLVHNSIKETHLSKKATLDISKYMPHTINLKTLTGKEIDIKCDINSTSVAEFKTLISCHEGIPEDQQRVIFEGKQLEDSKYLYEYEIKDKGILHLILRLRGGMYHEVSGRDGSYPPLRDVFYTIILG
jgi:hypothetical protein